MKPANDCKPSTPFSSDPVNKLMNSNLSPSRNPWPTAIILFFIGFFLFTAGLVVFASRQKMDLVRGDYYDEEIRYQEQLNRMNLTLPIADQVAIRYEATRQSIHIALPLDHGKKATGRIRLYRPSDESLDREIPLALDADGAQQVDASKLPSGLWKVRLYWTVEGKDYYFSDTVIVAPKTS